MSVVEPTDAYLPTTDRVVICLAGSGHRAAAFHVGCLHRLNELGLLAPACEFHAVGGGGLMLGILGVKWSLFEQDEVGRVLDFDHLVAKPIQSFVRRRWSLRPAVSSRLRPQNWPKLCVGKFSRTDRLIELIDRQIVGSTPIEELAGPGPSFLWYATNLTTGNRWEFSSTRSGEPAVGFRQPRGIKIAHAVVASMVEPDEFAPVVITSRPEDFEGGELSDETAALRRRAWLVDGSVQNPLALDVAMTRPGTIIVADGGSAVAADPRYDDWVGNRLVRSVAIQQQRGVELRRRWFVEAIQSGSIDGTYIGLAAHHADYGVEDSTGYSLRQAQEIWRLPSGFVPLTMRQYALLVNHGYTIADAAIRRLLPHRVRWLSPIRPPFAEGAADRSNGPNDPGRRAA